MKILCLVFLLVTLLVPETSMAAAAGDSGLVADILAEFKAVFQEVATVAKKYALTLFAYTATLEIAFLGVRAALGQAEIGETIKNFVFSVLTAGFFLAVINNYESWTQSIVSGLSSIAGEMTSVSDGIDNSFKLGLKLCTQIWNNVSATAPIASVGYAIASLTVLVVFCLITALVILVRCEAYIAMGVACILVGLGPFQYFRDYAINVLKYIFSVAFKLLTMQVVIGVGYTFINKLDLISSPDMSVIFSAVGVAIVLLALVKVLPDTVAGIINGSHIGGGGLTSAVRSVALGTMMAAGMAAATAKNVNYAHKIASAQGASGLGHVGSMASNLYSSWRESAHGKEGTSMSNALRQRIAAAEAPKG